VQIVTDVFAVVVTWQFTGEVIVERNRLYVVFVANDSHCQLTFIGTAEFTVDRNHTSVTCVTRRLDILEIYTVT